LHNHELVWCRWIWNAFFRRFGDSIITSIMEIMFVASSLRYFLNFHQVQELQLTIKLPLGIVLAAIVKFD